jgi:hypothetical protein
MEATPLVDDGYMYVTVVALDDQSLKPLYSFHAGTYIAVLGGGPASPRIQGPKAKADLSSLEATPMLFVFSL